MGFCINKSNYRGNNPDSKNTGAKQSTCNAAYWSKESSSGTQHVILDFSQDCISIFWIVSAFLHNKSFKVSFGLWTHLKGLESGWTEALVWGSFMYTTFSSHMGYYHVKVFKKPQHFRSDFKWVQKFSLLNMRRITLFLEFWLAFLAMSGVQCFIWEVHKKGIFMTLYSEHTDVLSHF